ncbi:malto-oligosyltrehalose synthase [Demequina zhanjiangensis]|uniref:Malto-oligosyltrehalose synthase n=1 Tax=Demequina zhanjiangensis TaxID=3051659 RepID=A0ABT8G0S1_9MICO|nr:malto-oligosyltrehalose synthase [Demequina sp. SYSU T00b26]MDN4472735.1 malto-oligosyltrehalose synthase [Demequina sp. SYSU T00b26]
MADGPHERAKRLGHRVDAPVPVSTYRLQLTEDFTFADAAARLDYFADLGVSHLYLSPILTAAPGSTHFYDVVDHTRIAQVLGGEEGLRELSWKAGERGIGLIADLVPNHMAVPTPVYHNRALWSVLAEGVDSPYAHWFDVDWSSGEPVLMPVLGQRLGSILSSEELQLDRMVVPGFEDAGEVPVLRYYDHVFPVKEGTENLPMATLVDEQNYRLAYWRVGNEELNYRRFFDVGSLVAVRVEDADVFDQTHRVIVDLVRDGTLDGLRIDHPDGLADPAGYIERLSEATDGAWIVVEKILEDDEHLPTSWKTAGTTGYDAAWRVGALLRDPAGAAPLAGTLYRLTGDALGSLPELIQDAKREIVKESLSSEVHRLANLAHQICVADVRLRDHTWRALYDCIRRMLVAFNRYRAYVVPGVPPKPMSLEAIDVAAAKARELLDPERYETLDVVVDLLKGQEVGSAGQTQDATRAELITRFQQACGAVMAKGVEDTAYYRWTHLLPLCEVGSPASKFALPPASFHAWAWEQQHTYPHAMTTLTTHDTKRSEDVRARLGVLSEMPDEWDTLMGQLHAAVSDRVPAQLDGRTENLWWQTLVGTSDEEGMLEWDRLSGYLTKAMRESKTHTTWTSIDEEYETAVQDFARQAHADEEVRALVTAWHHDTSEGVRAAVLGLKLVQLTMPGVPDVYQGNECLSPSLVDPDNRRPVDYDRREAALARLLKGGKPRNLSEEKLMVTARALRIRRDHRDAFIGDSAGYQALASSSGHAVVFARTVGDRPEVVTVATRVALELERLGGWADATVQLPEGTWTDVLGKASFEGGTVPLSALLRHHPVALLERAK